MLGFFFSCLSGELVEKFQRVVNNVTRFALVARPRETLINRVKVCPRMRVSPKFLLGRDEIPLVFILLPSIV